MSNATTRLLGLNSTRDLGECVVKHLGVVLSPHEDWRFQSGEHMVRSLTNVRGFWRNASWRGVRSHHHYHQ